MSENIGIRNELGKREIGSIARLISDNRPIANTGKIYYLRRSISPSVMASKEMTDLTREEMQARIEASEARTDTKIARIDGKLDLVLSKLDSAKSDNLVIRTNQWVIGLGLAVLIIAVFALFPVFFGLGTQIRDMVDSAV